MNESSHAKKQIFESLRWIISGKIFYLLTGCIKNISTMASLKLLLGMIPATSKIEQDEKALIAEIWKTAGFFRFWSIGKV